MKWNRFKDTNLNNYKKLRIREHLGIFIDWGYNDRHLSSIRGKILALYVFDVITESTWIRFHKLINKFDEKKIVCFKNQLEK